MSDFFPFSENNLAGGPARVMLAPITVAAPTKLSSIYAQSAPYTPVGTWFDLGATSGPTQVTRSITTGGFNIQQSQTAVLEEVTDVTRTVAIPIAELTPANLAILEESSGVVTVAAGTGYAPSKKIPFGSIFDLTQYRVAVVYAFKKASGIVTEPGGLTRGRSAAWVGYNGKLTADNVQVSVAEGELVSGTLTFKLTNDAVVTAAGAEQGFWIVEDAATIA